MNKAAFVFLLLCVAVSAASNANAANVDASQKPATKSSSSPDPNCSPSSDGTTTPIEETYGFGYTLEKTSCQAVVEIGESKEITITMFGGTAGLLTIDAPTSDLRNLQNITIQVEPDAAPVGSSSANPKSSTSASNSDPSAISGTTLTIDLAASSDNSNSSCTFATPKPSTDQNTASTPVPQLHCNEASTKSGQRLSVDLTSVLIKPYGVCADTYCNWQFGVGTSVAEGPIIQTHVHYNGGDAFDYQAFTGNLYRYVPTPLASAASSLGLLSKKNQPSSYVTVPGGTSYVLAGVVLWQPDDTGAAANKGVANTSGGRKRDTAVNSSGGSSKSASVDGSSDRKPSGTGTNTSTSRFNTDNSDYFNFASVASPLPDFEKTQMQDYGSDLMPFELDNVKNATQGYRLTVLGLPTCSNSSESPCKPSPGEPKTQIGLLTYDVVDDPSTTPVHASQFSSTFTYGVPGGNDTVLAFSDTVATLPTIPKTIVSCSSNPVPTGCPAVSKSTSYFVVSTPGPSAPPLSTHANDFGVQLVSNETSNLETAVRFVRDATNGSSDLFAAQRLAIGQLDLMAGWRNTDQAFSQPLGSALTLEGTQGVFYLADSPFFTNGHASAGFARWFSPAGLEHYETTASLKKPFTEKKRWSINGAYDSAGSSQNLILQQTLGIQNQLTATTFFPTHSGSLSVSYDMPVNDGTLTLEGGGTDEFSQTCSGINAASQSAQTIGCENQPTEKGDFVARLSVKMPGLNVYASHSSNSSEPSASAAVVRQAVDSAGVTWNFAPCLALNGAVYNRSSVDQISTTSGLTTHSEIGWSFKGFSISGNYDVSEDHVTGLAQHSFYFRFGKPDKHQSDGCILERRAIPDLAPIL